MNQNENCKIICFYFPQFHPIEENNKYWGEGFTDWEFVKKAKPLFAGHYQPRVPKNQKYYNPTDMDVLKWQVDLAINAGVHGFCFYHYWFDGKLLLEKPLENFLSNKDLDLNFCLSWANPTWTKSWVGRDYIVIQKQNYISDKNLWEKHFYYLKQFWDDERYIKINNKPIFIFYQPETIKHLSEMLLFWNSLCEKNKMDGIYYIVTKSYPYKLKNEVDKLIDAVMKFQPREAYNSPTFKNKSFFAARFFQTLRKMPEPIWNILSMIFYSISRYEKINYDSIWEHIVSNADEFTEDKKTILQGAFVDWDNTARYGSRAKIFYGASPEKFYYWMQKLIETIKSHKNNIIFLDSWNEWSEGAYLEPDEKYNHAYLDVIKKLLRK